MTKWDCDGCTPRGVCDPRRSQHPVAASSSAERPSEPCSPTAMLGLLIREHQPPVQSRRSDYSWLDGRPCSSAHAWSWVYGEQDEPNFLHGGARSYSFFWCYAHIMVRLEGSCPAPCSDSLPIILP